MITRHPMNRRHVLLASLGAFTAGVLAPMRAAASPVVHTGDAAPRLWRPADPWHLAGRARTADLDAVRG